MFTAAAVLVVFYLIQPLVTLHVTPPLLLAVAGSALVAGTGPGILAVVLTVLALNYWFLPPYGTFAFVEGPELARQNVYVISGFLVALLGGAFRKARAQSEFRARESERLRAVAQRSLEQAEEERCRAESLAVTAQEQAALAEEEALHAEEEAARAEREAGRAEEAAAQAAGERAQLAEIVEHMPVGVIVAAAPSGNILAWNGQVNRIWRHPPVRPEGLVRYENYHAFHPDGRPYEAHEWPLARALSHGESVEGEEIRFVRGDGTEGWMRVSSAPIHQANGAVSAGVVVFEDVTDHKRAEEHLRQTDRLQVVGQLAGGIAHEANNQMTVVLGASDLILADRTISPTVRKDVEYIREAAHRTGGITRQLLIFSRRQSVQSKAVDLNSAIRGVEPILRRTLTEKQRLILRLNADDPRVRADPQQLDQVFLNLVLNARDAMPHGGIFIVETGRIHLGGDYPALKPGMSVRPGPYVSLLVSDTGVGMNPATLQHIFEPFFTTKEVGQGTGLGLSIVYGIVKQHGGYIFVSSQPGQGTTFKIYLPSTDETEAAPPEDRPVPSGEGRVLLVVEDDELVRTMSARALRRWGYQVSDAAHGLAAMELLPRLGRLDAVITDLAMPEVGGRELAQWLSRYRPGVPVLFTSGYADRAMGPDTAHNGYAFLEKPFTLDDLGRAVADLLGRSASVPEDDAARSEPPPVNRGAALNRGMGEDL